MYSTANVICSFVFLNIAGCVLPKFWNHPYATDLQNKLLYVWKVVLHISKISLKNTEAETPTTMPYFEQESCRPIEILSNKCPDVCQDTKSYVDRVFMILKALFFTCVVIWYIWNHGKKQKDPSRERSNKPFKNEDRDKLKEVHNILWRLDQQLVPIPPSKIPRLLSSHSLKESKSQVVSSRNQFWYESRRQGVERKLNNEELRQNLQAALQLLEEVIIDTKNTSEIQECPETESLVTNFECNDDEHSAYQSQQNKNTSDEIEDINTEKHISNFEKDETVFSDANDIIDTKLSTNLKEQKYREANVEFSNHQVLLASCSDNVFSDTNYSPMDHKEENPSSKRLHSNASSLSNSQRKMSNEDQKKDIRKIVQDLKKEATNEKFVTNEFLKHHQGDISGLENSKSENASCELRGQANTVNTKPIMSNSSVDKNVKNEQKKPSEITGFVYETLKSHQETISGLKTDERGRTLYELENQWNEMIRTPVKFNSMEDVQMKRFESNGFASVEEVRKTRLQSSPCDVTKSEDTNKVQKRHKECLNQKEVLTSLDHQVDSEDVTLRRRVAKDISASYLYGRCSENSKSGSAFQGLNLNKLQPASAGSRIVSVDESSKQTIKASTKSGNLNVTARNNALNISILFDRDIKLAKCAS